MFKNLPVYWNLVKLQALAQVESRGAVNILFFAKLIGFGFGYIVIWIMLDTFQSIAGWTLWEVIFLQALYNMAYALSSAFFGNPCGQLPNQVASGEFDAVLTRPVNSLLYYMFRVFSTGYIGNIAMALSMLILSWIKLGLGFDALKLLYLLAVIVGGALIQSALYILAAVPNFWLVKGGALNNIVVFDSAQFVRYPLSTFHGVIQAILTFLIPYAFINFYPACLFLGKAEGTLFHPIFQFLTPAIGLALFILAQALWKHGINHYQSSGS